MMKLYIKQKVFSWGDKFTVYDENENVYFTVEGEVFTLGKKLHIYDSEGREQAFVSQKLLSFLPRFFIFRNGTPGTCSLRYRTKWAGVCLRERNALIE